MKNKQRIGLALGSGGPRGLAHIGVIRALNDAHLVPDIVTGTSAGSVIGGLYDYIQDIDAVENIFMNITVRELTAMFTDLTRGSGIIKGNRLEKFLDKYLEGVTIENLTLPFAAIATDIHTAKDVVFTQGSLTKAIRASSSVPAFFDLYDSGSGLLMDGGVSQPVPIRAAKELGADKVIAVNLDGYNFASVSLTTKPAMPRVGFAAIKLLRYRLSQELCREADLCIEPDVANFTWSNLPDKKLRKEIIDRGYEATAKALSSSHFLA